MINNSSKLEEIIKGIGDVGMLSSENLINISSNLFKLIEFCNCIDSNHPKLTEDDHIKHECNKFNHHDSEHAPKCKCCQTKMLLYYLGRGMEKLADEDKLPIFIDKRLSPARIRDRTYGHERNDAILKFKILRHPNAWKDPNNMKVRVEVWKFDFNKLTLYEES